MKKIDYKNLILTCSICLLPMIIGIIMYKKLPDNIAVHFDVNNTPDNYFSKFCFVFGTPIFMAAIQAYTFIRTELNDNNKQANKKATTVYKWIIPIISVVVYVLTILYAMGNSVDFTKIISIMLGIMLIIMGNYSPKTVTNRFNKVPRRLLYFFRKKYSRIYGYILILNGILLLISILFKPIISFIIVISMVLETLALYLYALLIRK